MFLRLRPLLFLFAFLSVPTAAQSVSSPEDLSSALHDAQRAHLWRVGVWGGANVALGLGLLLAQDRNLRPGRFGFGVQATAWGAINMGIATVGLLGASGSSSAGWTDVLRAENAYHDILLLNLGLNVGYIGVGAAMWWAGRQEVRHAEAWKGHGSAIVMQGLGLLVLDGIAFLGSRGRFLELLDLSPTGVRLSFML